ncbi:MAG: hypothetical protein CSA65_02805 [Proteobacteria bacterium]|nr:MAG: hypothetical protein CSB49_01480 [Pseudomonadota bacterium]PIE19325.1 MAG: hypothetical protein CSA65_02805 [Pseudomonadota bacterium]
MKTAVLSLATAALLVTLAPAEAAAQCCHKETVHVYEYGPVYRVKRLRRVRRVRPWYPLRWAAGVHLTGVTTNQELNDEGVALGGIGGHLRFRNGRFGSEVAFDVIGNSFLDGGVQRVSVPVQASALLYIIPRGVFNLYLLGGMQLVFTHVEWDLPNLYTDQTFTQFGLHAGVGGELNLGRYVALTADVRFFGLLRSDESGDGTYYQGIDQDAVVPHKVSGAQINLGVLLRF